ncbi:histidine triad nucleotide-binding protein [Truepera radiovictrix]|uniref:Histidine triad (HIT) protein n=1 Tax=Truepera radiovictrix (strain DSM 17093 / CIP 108686 / LMG 22925 / RQ-24) TaxID=649638 RepID=D7CV11_TRURR|nr:histidine triad nucleotide-binding protein [Truepera radiovictrix]ADI15838.1 histidine triad (HIT) protein [Truepera radiovictrix DSM 17093]WMT58536.1 histidine triad nucleotide-binding protein [Truepera radiovictrix]
MSEKGVFQKIIDGEIPAERVYEDEEYLAFKDIAPKAPVHFLVISKKHSPRLDEMLDAEGPEAVGGLMAAAVRTARHNGLTDYRLVINVGPGAGQEVFHTHVHILAGREKPLPVS